MGRSPLRMRRSLVGKIVGRVSFASTAASAADDGCDEAQPVQCFRRRPTAGGLGGASAYAGVFRLDEGLQPGDRRRANTRLIGGDSG